LKENVEIELTSLEMYTEKTVKLSDCQTFGLSICSHGVAWKRRTGICWL